MVVADANLFDTAAAADIDQYFPSDQPRVACKRIAQLGRQEHILPLLQFIKRFHLPQQHFTHAAGISVDRLLHIWYSTTFTGFSQFPH